MSESEVSELRADVRSISTKLDTLIQKFTESSSKHSQRLKHVEDDLKLAHTRISAVKKWIFGGVVGIASMLAKFAWSFVEGIARKG